MRDINKYLLAPIGENGSSVRARNQPHPNSLYFTQTVKDSKCDEYIILFCIRWENDGSWICLVWSSWIHLIEYVRLDIEAWNAFPFSKRSGLSQFFCFFGKLSLSSKCFSIYSSSLRQYKCFLHIPTQHRVICVGALWGLVRAQRKLYNAAAKKISNLRIFLLPLNSTKGQLLLHQLFEELKTQKPNI